MENLWPEDIVEEVDVKSPAAILKEQASLLGKKTKNLVIGEVRSEEPSEEYYSTYFQYSFSIKAPALSGYRYKLFEIRYSVALYPLTFRSIDDHVRGEVFPDTKSYGSVEVVSEDDFVDTLRKIFKAARTRQVITTLLAQTKV